MTIGSQNENLPISSIDPVLQKYEQYIDQFAYITTMMWH